MHEYIKNNLKLTAVEKPHAFFQPEQPPEQSVESYLVKRFETK